MLCQKELEKMILDRFVSGKVKREAWLHRRSLGRAG